MSRANDPFFPEGFPQPPDRYVNGGHELKPRSTALAVGTSQANTSQAGFPEPAALLRALRQNLLVGVCLGLIAGMLAGSAAWKFLPKPRFTAKNKLEIKLAKPVLLMETVQEKQDQKSFQSAQLSLINSSLVLEAALKKPGIADLPSVKAQAEPAEWLEGEIITEFPNGTELMEVSITGSRPDDLVPLVNAVTDAYLDEIVNKDERDRLMTISQLKDLHDQGENDLAARRAEMRKLAESVGSVDRSTLAVQHNAIFEELTAYRNDKVRSRTERKQAESELAVLNEAAMLGARKIDPIEIESYLSADDELRDLKMQINKATTRLEAAGRLSRSGDDPSVKNARKARDTAKRAYDERVAQLTPKIERRIRAEADSQNVARIAELEAKVKTLLNLETELEQNIAQLEAQAKSFNSQSLDLTAMKEAIEQKEETNKKIGHELEALGIETRAPQRVRVIERAKRAKSENPNKRLIAVAMIALGAFLGAVVLVSWREYRLRRVDTPKEVVDGLGLRLVGTLPQLPVGRESSRGRGLPSPERWQNLLIESIDAARTVLLRESRHCALRTIMVTSASKGEGKSSLSSHLAISLARTGRRTLLADFDLRSPTAHHLFEIEKGPGTSELLRGEIELEDAVQNVMADLDVLSAGASDSEAIRALGQDALPRLLEKMSEQYDFVVVDTAPVLPVADALLISGHVDAVILSVYRDISRMPSVIACKERLESLGVHLLGVVVTGIPVENFGPEYSYAARPESYA